MAVSKKTKGLILLVVGILLMAGVLYTGVLLFFEFKFLILEDLVLWLSPPSKSVSLSNSETETLDFLVTTNNNFFCDASCDYEWRDVSKNRTVQTSSFSIPVKEEYSLSFQVTTPETGRGQELYDLEVSCTNIRTLSCRTPEMTVTRSAFVTVNYAPSEQLQALIDRLKGSLSTYLATIAGTDSMLLSVEDAVEELPKQFVWSRTGLDKAQEDLESMKADAESFHLLWDLQSFIELDSQFTEKDIESADQLNKDSIVLQEELGVLENLHNETVDKYDELLPSISILMSIYQTAYLLDDIPMAAKLNLKADQLRSLTGRLESGKNPEYSLVMKEMLSHGMDIEELQTEVDESIKSLALELESEKNYLNQLLCSMKSYCMVHATAQPKDTDDIENLCEDITRFDSTTADLHHAGLMYEKYLNLTEKKTATVMKRAVTDSLNLTAWTDSFEFRSIVESFESDYAKALRANPTATPIIPDLASTPAANLSNEIKLDILLMGVRLDELIVPEDIQRTCGRAASDADLLMMESSLKIRPPFVQEAVFPKVMISFKEFESEFNTKLTSHLPECCVLSSCKPCCTGEECQNDPLSYPIIFIHGHAFSKATTPDSSLSMFNKIQREMEQDGFINAGFLSLETDPESIGKGTWGFSGRPVTVKVTYYYDVYTEDGKYITLPEKSESIDVYAIRLKEIIDTIKYVSDKPRVNIIAHSMGGLVSRRYIQIFGEESVDNLIMVGTPNQGIEGKVESYCTLLGEKQECEDMAADSVFLKKLNNPDRQPNFVELMTIRGEGCDMEGKDGDGVVLSSNVPMDNAENKIVRGSCKGSLDTLHMNLLDVDKHPESYQFIKIALLS